MGIASQIGPGACVHVGLWSILVTVDPSQIVLERAGLHRLPPSVAVPTYDRTGLRRSIVHLGVGGFHRAHLADYIHELCEAGRHDWAIVGAGVLPGDVAMAGALIPQDCLYTLISRGTDSTTVEVIGSIVDYIHASPNTEPLLDAIANPTTQVVSLTVTEGGYPVDDLTGRYLPTSPTAGPASAFGIIAAGLQRRRERGGSGLTVISCDNIIGNGAAARTATLGEAHRLDDALAEWIGRSVAFPNSMVDRITPATTDADRRWLTATTGIIDNWPVVTEPFRQWVIEDEFAADRLPLDDLDVIVTTDVEPYELMKLRLLNATHSCVAYLAALAGIDAVHEAFADRRLHDFAVGFLEHEARPVVPSVAGIDLAEYTKSLIERFSNPNIGDQIARLCLDGSAKFPKFLLPTIRTQLERGGRIELGALALAGWCEYLLRPAEQLAADPLLDTARRHAERSRQDPAAFLDFVEVFGDDLPRSQRFSDAFAHSLRLVRERGVPSAIDITLDEIGLASDGKRD